MFLPMKDLCQIAAVNNMHWQLQKRNIINNELWIKLTETSQTLKLEIICIGKARNWLKIVFMNFYH